MAIDKRMPPANLVAHGSGLAIDDPNVDVPLDRSIIIWFSCCGASRTAACICYWWSASRPRRSDQTLSNQALRIRRDLGNDVHVRNELACHPVEQGHGPREDGKLGHQANAVLGGHLHKVHEGAAVRQLGQGCTVVLGDKPLDLSGEALESTRSSVAPARYSVIATLSASR